MARAICADKSNHLEGEDELAFLSDVQKLPSKSHISSRNSSSDLNIYQGMRRNSSYAQYFEGDLSQNLLSRRHFLHRDSEEQSDTVSAIVSHVRNEDGKDLRWIKNNGDGGKKKGLSKLLLPSNWFFKNHDEQNTNLTLPPPHHRRTISEPAEATEDDEHKESNKSSLSQLISKHFSATNDVRAFNIIIPQSQ
eukprot:GFUD01026699.1.p1 GENE.GFUD01026699.1~~GFUD01026699.1.p1  ORF type:complete len:223 (+),score=57.43 GFUD01026699.1:93-671(+)